MNIAFFLKPKHEIAYLYDTYTIRQALEKMHHHGYTAIPVITDDGKYAGTVGEGDFLWYLVQGEGGEPIQQTDIQKTEKMKLADLPFAGRYEPVSITATIEQLMDKAITQNFVPVVDDLGSFIGIVTRQDILRYFYSQYADRSPKKE